MTTETINQSYLFLIFMINGIVIGIFFDVFRILRKSFKTSNIVTYIEDILFWLLTGLLLIYSIFVFNNGEIRGYIFIAIILGVLLYMFSISQYFIKISVNIINFIKKIIVRLLKIILTPFLFILKWIKKILIKPVYFICINLRKKMSNLVKKIKLNSFFNKKVQKNDKKVTD